MTGLDVLQDVRWWCWWKAGFHVSWPSASWAWCVEKFCRLLLRDRSTRALALWCCSKYQNTLSIFVLCDGVPGALVLDCWLYILRFCVVSDSKPPDCHMSVAAVCTSPKARRLCSTAGLRGRTCRFCSISSCLPEHSVDVKPSTRKAWYLQLSAEHV